MLHFDDSIIDENAIVDDPTVEFDLNNLPLNIEIEMAEFELSCAIARLSELHAQRREQDALDAHVDAQFAEYQEIEWGKAVMASDKADKEIAEVQNA